MGDQKYQITRKHEKRVRGRCSLRDVYLCLQATLSKTQLEKLNLCEANLIYTAEDQLLLRYTDNRYWECLLDKDALLEQVKKCIETYKFLLDSNLESSTIRYVFLKALTDVVSIGSGVYHLKWDSWYDEWIRNRSLSTESKSGNSGAELLIPTPSRLRKNLRSKFQDTFEEIDEKYSRIPSHKILKNNCLFDRKAPEHIIRFLWEQLWISYSYPLFLREKKRGELDLEEFKLDFFKRHKWCLERLSRGNQIFINKHKEKLCEDLAYSLGKDPDVSYHILVFPSREEINISQNVAFVSTIQNLIIGCFSPEELSLFNEQDEEENAWNFEDQIHDRYYSRFPTFASLDEIEERIKATIEKYKPLLNVETAEVIREIILDEVERIAFVSPNTHLWNQEMEKNLASGKTNKTNRNVAKVVDVLISYLPAISIDKFSAEKEGKIVGLKEQLLARWARAFLATNIKKFKQYLSRLSIYTPNSPSNWSATPSRVDLQAFLGEIDMFFLYPRKNRKLKMLMRRLDTGRVVGGINEIKRTYMSFAEPDRFLMIWYALWFLLVFALIITIGTTIGVLL